MEPTTTDARADWGLTDEELERDDPRAAFSLSCSHGVTVTLP